MIINAGQARAAVKNISLSSLSPISPAEKFRLKVLTSG